MRELDKKESLLSLVPPSHLVVPIEN